MGVLLASRVKTDLKLNPTQFQKVLLESYNLVALLAELLLSSLLMELGGQLLAGALAQRPLDKLAGLTTLVSGKAFCRDGGHPLGADDNLDGLH